jgi:hypothetical protein
MSRLGRELTVAAAAVVIVAAGIQLGWDSRMRTLYR